MPQLSDLIDLPAHPLIAIVGAGGKTTTMYTLASELAQRGKRVITTTTTQIFFPQPDETDALIFASETSILLNKIHAAWKQHKQITVTGLPIREDKLGGLQPEQANELLTKSGTDAMIVEADGARHKMIKAPAEHEPVIPTRTNVALLLMSAGAINKPLSTEIAHRPEHIAWVTGISQQDILSPAVIAKLMTSDQGALKHIPATAATYLLITHASMTQKETIFELVWLVRRSARITGVLSSEHPGEWVAL